MNSFKNIFGVVLLSVVGLGMMSGDFIERMTSTKERPIAIVRKFKPKVGVQNLANDKFLELDLKENLGEKLYSGDTLVTNEDGYALVLFMDESVAKVKPNSMLVVRGDVENRVKSMNTRIDMKKGEIFLNVQPQGTSDFEVATSRSLASVKGTDFGSTSEGYVWVESGHVDLTALNSGQTVSLFDKMFGQVDTDGNEIDSGTLSDEDLNNLAEGYDEMENNYEKKVLKLQFRDENGQLREIEIELFEESKQN